MFDRTGGGTGMKGEVPDKEVVEARTETEEQEVVRK